jgi:16S rRNA (uracil1498-N3)-methyltransferase
VNRVAVPKGALDVPNSTVQLEGESAHKLRLVLRLREGDEVELFDGVGVQATGVISHLDELRVLLKIGEVRRELTRVAPLQVAQALVKGDKLELVIQKATELGASAIWPFRAQRSVVKLEGERASERVGRWRKIASEAARQCGRADVPDVAELTDLAGILARPGPKAFLYEGEKTVRLSHFLDEVAASSSSTELLPRTLIIGPEGGFSGEEVEAARAAGARIVGLGPRILRTETVALVALAIALHRQGELG